MNYFIHPIWFYLMGIGDGLKDVFVFLAIGAFVGILIVIGMLMFFDMANEDDKKKWCVKHIKRLIVIVIISTIVFVLVPDSNTVEKMAVASCITHENAEYTKEQVKDIVDYITDTIKGNNEE